MTLRMYLKSRAEKVGRDHTLATPVLSSLGQGGGQTALQAMLRRNQHGPRRHRLWGNKAASSDNRALHVKASSHQVTLT